MPAENPGILRQLVAALCTRPYAPGARSFGPAGFGQHCPIAAGWLRLCTTPWSRGSGAPCFPLGLHFLRVTEAGGQARTGASRFPRPPQTDPLPASRRRSSQPRLVALPDGQGFRESSTSWWHRVWWHERTLLDDPDGCIVRDDVQIEPRLGVADPIIGWTVRRMFQRRHQHLRRQFG